MGSVASMIELVRRGEGSLPAFDAVSDEVVRRNALEEGIELTDEHWVVIDSLREDYRALEGVPAARDLLDRLSERFETRGGRRYLFWLFPAGPVTQIARIAGLPAPEHGVDPSFGVAW